MRIDKISITNIASLQGSHHIDFNEVSSTSSLFAITGKTGSGKSTILNCISLALYGSTYKTSITSIDYITLGTEQGEIEVFYSIGNKTYKANWKLRVRKKNGEALKKPLLNRANYEVSPTGIETAIEALPEELIGLNFKQFCKTSILNQGQFAEFLMSKFTERKEILEKLYDGENLEKLNIKLKEKIKITKEEEEKYAHQVKGLTEALESDILSPKELENLNQEVQNNLKLSQKLIEVGKTAQDILDLQETIHTNQNRLEGVKQQHKQEKENFIHSSKTRDHIQDEREKIQAILEKRKPFLLKAIEKIQELRNIQKQKGKIEQDINKNQQKLSENEIRLKEYKNEILNSEQRVQKAYELYPFFENIDHNLFKRSYEAFLEIKSFLPKLEKESLNKNSSLQELQEAKHKLKETNNDIKLEIEQLEKDVRDFDKSMNTETLFKLKKNSERLENIRSSHSKSLAQKKDLMASIQDHTKEYEFCKSQLEIETLKLSNLEKEIQLNRALADINLLIEKSKEGGHCILCGTEHSSDFQYPEKNLDQSIFNDRENKRQKVQELNLQVNKFQEVKNKEELKLAHIESLLNQENEEKNILENEILNIIDKPLTHDSVQTFIKDLEDKIKLTEAKNEKLLILKNQYTNNLNREEETKKEIDKKSSEYETIREQIKIKNEELNFLETRYAIFSQTVDEVKKVNNYKEKLQQIINELNFLNQNTVIIEKSVQEITTDIKNLNQENTSLTDKIILLETYIADNNIPEDPSSELESLETNLSDMTLKLTNANNDLKIIEIRLAELRSKIDGYIEQINQTELFLKTTFVDLREKSTKLTELKYPSEVSKIKEINLKFTQLHLEELHQEVFTETLSEFENLLNHFKDYNQMKRDQFVREENKTNTHAINQKKIQKLKLEIDKIHSELEKLENLYSLIGKDEFRNYVLSIIENNLLEQTNAELNLLCQGRYILGQTNKSNKMASEFIVIDNFRDGMSRKVATLSGGETFLVSLAMAMALAELTRGKTQVDSLFIDEGFGTLDSDSINEVYELLQSIQNSGKQIGIISHVSDLTNRIPVNIFLKKNQQGISDISVLLN